MKKLRIALQTGITALAIAATPGLATAQQAGSSVTVYGIMDAAVEWSRAGEDGVARLTSGAGMGSRFGFTGKEDLGDGWAALFRIEQGLSLDDGQLGQGGRAWGREASVALSNTRLGMLQAGRLPTPYYSVLWGVDAFVWMGGGGMLALTRSGQPVRQVLANGANARHDNAVGFVSPSLDGLVVRALVSAGEGSTAIGRGYSFSARYTNAPVDLVLGAVRQDGAGSSGGRAQGIVVGGSYDFGSVKAYAGYTVEKNSCATCTGALARVTGVGANGSSEFRLLNMGARVPVGAFTVIAQLVKVADRSEYAVNPGSRDATWIAVGGEYALSRRTVAFTSIGSIGNQNGSQYAIGSGGAQQPAGYVGAGDPRSTTLTLGVRHSF